MKGNKEYQIMKMLPIGKENAISSDDLCTMLNLSNKRELQIQIANERKSGAVILSTTTGGYYQSNDRAEIEEFVRTLEKRAKSTMYVLRSARKYLKNLDGQLEMELEGMEKGKAV